jgi:UTP--glucose-1-phosphate uridylyltransferase
MHQTIKKVIIPAAGLGTRFLPMTKAQPKEMLPVVDKPVIQYVVEEAVSSGIEDILIITGRGKRAIEDHFDHSFELESKLSTLNKMEFLHECIGPESSANIFYIRQKEQRGLGDAILCAEKHCDDQPFAVLLGDTITIPHQGYSTCTQQMIDIYNKYRHSVIAIEPVPKEKIQDYGIISGHIIDQYVYSIQQIIEKPKLEEAPSNLGAIGRYILTPDIFELLKTLSPGFGREIQLTDALQQLKNKIGVITHCTRYDIGDKLGWMKSNLELTMKRKEFADELRKFIPTLL